jgi:hypothetical protein
LKKQHKTYYVQNYKPKRQYPQNYRHHNKYRPPAINNNFFQGNIASNMKFGGRDHDLSGYVKREIVIIDRHGNKQIAREKQFFNSGKRMGRVRINEDESEF